MTLLQTTLLQTSLLADWQIIGSKDEYLHTFLIKAEYLSSQLMPIICYNNIRRICSRPFLGTLDVTKYFLSTPVFYVSDVINYGYP